MKNYLLIIILLLPINNYCILFNTLKEIFAICDALTDFNETMRNETVRAIKDFANLSGPEEPKEPSDNNIVDKVKSKNSIDKIKEKVGFSKMAGFIPEDVKEVVDFIKYPEKFRYIGAKMPKGLLLVGPPGTGKTSIARAIAEESGANFFNASGTEFIEMYVGVGPQRIRDLFSKARAAKGKSIIFIDELDAIGGSRSGEMNSEYRNTLNELLNQMDGFTQNENITVIGATNTPESIDSALKRPGRFDKIILVSLPDYSSRLKIIKLYCESIRYDFTVKFESLAEKTEDFSPAEIKNLVNEAAILAVRSNDLQVNNKHFEKALYNIKLQKSL